MDVLLHILWVLQTSLQVSLCNGYVHALLLFNQQKLFTLILSIYFCPENLDCSPLLLHIFKCIFSSWKQTLWTLIRLIWVHIVCNIDCLRT